MRRLIAAALILGIVLLALLFYASSGSSAFSDTLPTLFVVGGVLGVALLVLLGWRLWWLQKRIRRGVFGSKLTLKLLLMFGVVAMLPGLVVYGASVFFLNRSIETWFDVRVDNALTSGVNLGQAALDDLLRELEKKAQRMALTLSDEGIGSTITSLSTLREQSAVQELTLFDERGGLIAHVSGERGTLLPVLPERSVLWQVRQQQPYSRIEEVAERGLIMRVIVPVYTSALTSETRVLQLVQPVPAGLARDAQAVQLAYQDYQQIAVSRLGLKRIYGLALTLTLMLALLMTMVIAYLLSERLGAPLRTLARGTRAVAKGDFSQMPMLKSRDELGVLIQSFNRMTRQLSDAREQVAQNHQETEQAKAFLERVLANLSSGVVVLDDALRVRTTNGAAAQILGVDAALLDARPLTALGQPGEALHEFGATVAARFAEHEGEWQEQIGYAGAGGSQTLLLRGTRLPPGVERGYVLVFDDVTTLIDAERNAAWSEVARRLAHEIKNPLTPIQLSAERIARKLAGRLEAADAEFLARATQTIVNQVAAMKGMVDAFAGYARMPRARLEALDLNALVGEVLALYDAKALGLRLNLEADLPRIAGDSTLLRQVIHNLLQNAQDALTDHPAPSVEVSTRINNNAVCLTVMDNGAGFPEHLMTRLFEPYATTKAKGTGLGLAIVKKIVEEHHGKIQIENLKTGGAAIRIALPVFAASGGQV
ncbi:MAG: HAMP domain-containing protein [Gammaproteobacteria bacterium]|nr:HAMP domain-containing protein [Gammaproteobacteria bacterium]MBU1409560.1 HAMP domain-containing protein [Gammaproteobacteria bacterium]MBU1530742.1 HAMP domain-containing protein [Gammaproteobacteria bacterium]